MKIVKSGRCTSMQSKAKVRGAPLTERQELLLCRYFDDECGMISKILAQRLVRNHAHAQEFIESLSNVGRACREDRESATAHECQDLWDRISMRIDAEERAALYLGERKPSAHHESLFSRVKISQALFGGISGAAVTAMALLVFVGPREQVELPTIARGSTGTATQGGSFTQVALGGSGSSVGQHNRTAMVTGQPNAMEVDWMRANGPLKFIQNPEGKSAIIWVRKRTPQAAGRVAKATPIASPLLSNPPTQQMFLSSH